MRTAIRAINAVRTLSARFITQHSVRPRALQIRAWAWLAAETEDLAGQKRSLEAIVALDPSLDWVQAALTRVWRWWLKGN